MRNILRDDDAFILYYTHIFHFYADVMLVLCLYYDFLNAVVMPMLCFLYKLIDKISDSDEITLTQMISLRRITQEEVAE